MARLQEDKNGFVYEEAADGVVIVDYKGKKIETLFVPSTIDGKTVTGIAKGFSSKGLTSVTIPDCVTFIGKDAFRSNEITSLKLGSGIVSIGEFAFKDNKITSLNLGSNIVSIENYAFNNNKLEGVLTLPKGVKQIGMHAFSSNKELTEAIVPENARLGSQAFGSSNGVKITKVPGEAPTAQTPPPKEPQEAAAPPEQDSSASIEQAKQAVADLLATAYPDQAMRNTMMENFEKTPIANTVAFWESVRQGLAVQTGGVQAMASAQAAPQATPAAGGGTKDYEFTAGDGGGVMITRYNGRADVETMEVPSQIDGKPVTGIGEKAFGFNEFKSVTIPDSVTFIGEKAFSSCHFEKLILGSGIEVIEKSAFYNNNLSGSLTLPRGVKVIDSLAFGSNPNLSEIVVPDGITIAKDAFSTKTKVANASGEAPAVQIKAEKPKYITCACGYNYPADVWFCTKCGVRTALPEPVVDSSLNPDNTFEAQTIRDQQRRVEKFSQEKFLAEQKAKTYNAGIVHKDGSWVFKIIDNTVTITGYEGKATALEIPSQIQGMSVVEIGEKACYKKGLTGVNIPASVKFIGDHAFHSNKLTAITIPGTVATVERDAFARNPLTRITIEEGVQTIGDSAFDNTTKINETESKIANVVIPASMKKIGRRAFFRARIATVTISKGVEIIGEEAFEGNQLKSVVIPEGVREIGERAFDQNFIESVSLPDSLRKIGDDAFCGNKGANQIPVLTLPPNLQTLGAQAFSGNLLTEIVIPGSIKTMGERAFSGNLLTEIVIPGNITIIREGAFAANQLSRITMCEGVQTIGKRAFMMNKLENWQNISFPASLTEIGEKAFTENKMSGEITVPETIEKIGNGAFYKNQLTGVEIRGATKIGNESFFSNKISKLIIGSRVESIGAEAFQGNKPLVGATIPESVKKIFHTPIPHAAFRPDVFIERAETDALSFSDTAYWQAFEQKAIAAGAGIAKKPAGLPTFHDKTGALIGKMVDQEFLYTHSFSYNNYFRGNRGRAFIYDPKGKSIVQIYFQAPHDYISEWQVFAYFIEIEGRILHTFVTLDGIVLSDGKEDLTSESKGIINPSAKAAAEKYRVGNVKIEGDVGVAYDKNGVKVGEVRNAGAYGAVCAGAILLYLLK